MLPGAGEVVVWRGHSQGTFPLCLLISLCVPHWPNPGQAQRAESLSVYSTLVSFLGQIAGWSRFDSDSGEADRRQLGHLGILSNWVVLVARYLWRSQVVGVAVFWSRTVWDRITSAPLANGATLSSLKFSNPLFPHCTLGARVMPT